MSILWLLIPASFLVAFALTGGVMLLLRRRAVLDHPNERSSHSVPTPRGGGLAVLPVVAASWLLIGLDGAAVLVLSVAILLALLSFADDLWQLPALPRLAGQAVAVAVGLFALPQGQPVFQGLLPPGLDLAATGVLWLWFVNLFNFMDGIDGISGVESIAIACGTTLVAALTGGLPTATGLGLPLAAAVAGFLAWNWPPAKIFLGDVGSVALGFLLGWLLLSLAAGGEWAAAVLLPLYYLADASFTLCRRLVQGERIWQPHRQHFYQQGARRLGSHGAVDLRLIGLNCVLTALAVLSAWQPGLLWPALAAGAVLVGLTMRGFAEHAEGASHAA